MVGDVEMADCSKADNGDVEPKGREIGEGSRIEWRRHGSGGTVCMNGCTVQDGRSWMETATIRYARI